MIALLGGGDLLQQIRLRKNLISVIFPILSALIFELVFRVTLADGAKAGLPLTEYAVVLTILDYMLRKSRKLRRHIHDFRTLAYISFLVFFIFRISISLL